MTKCLSNGIVSLTLSLVLLAGCGKGPEQNRFTTPDREVELPPGLSDELEEAHGSYALAKEAMEREDWVAAAEQLEWLLEGPSAEAVFANDLGYVEMQMDNMERALAALDRAVSLDPEYERAHYNRGMALTRLKRPDEAIEAYRKAIALNDFYYEAWINLGLLYYKEGDLEESRKAFLKVTDRTRSSRFNKAYYQLGLIAANTGDDAEAVEYYSESILLDPSHVPSYINKGTALLRLEQLSGAEEALEKAASLDPENYLAHYNLGLVLRRQEKFAEAKAAYRKAVALKPASKKAWLNLGYVHAFLGETGKAEDAFARALEIDPGYKTAQTAIDNLQAGLIEP
jgi:tetratricopeptide (TPR) repeat protein